MKSSSAKDTATPSSVVENATRESPALEDLATGGTTMKKASHGREPGLWKRGLLWLLFLGPFFFLSYGFANSLAAERSDVGRVVFDWETAIPLWPWTIIPYWSIDLLYGLSLLLPSNRRELDRHGLRLLSVQLLCVACFLIWPLTFTFERPEMGGVFGWLFEVLMGFDKPFNQAPSLHIALLVVLWTRFSAHTPRRWQPLLHLWFALIGISVLTTWQHHFIDLPTGALAGFICLWLWPTNMDSPFSYLRLSKQSQRRRLGTYYLGAAALLGILSLTLGGWALWLCWPAVSLLLVGLNYWMFGAQGFQKQDSGPRAGRLSVGALGLLAPYLGAAWLNSRLWTHKAPQPGLVAEQVWLGRFPDQAAREHKSGLIDLCAELPINPRGLAYRHFPVLDLTPPSVEVCREAAYAIEQLRQQGSVLVFCALGYSRSATAVAAWLLLYGNSANVAEAQAQLRLAQPKVVLSDAHLAVLASLIKMTHGSA